MINESGYTNDKQRKFLGLQQITGIVEEVKETISFKRHYRHRRAVKKRPIRKNRFRRVNRFDDDDQIELSDEETSGDNFDAYDYYDSESTLKTVLHLFVQAYSYIKKCEY